MDLTRKINYFLKNAPTEKAQNLKKILQEVHSFVEDVTVGQFEMEAGSGVILNNSVANTAAKNYKNIDEKKVDSEVENPINISCHLETMAPVHCNAESLEAEKKENNCETTNGTDEPETDLSILELPLEKGWRRETTVSSIDKHCRVEGNVCYYAPGSRIKLEDMSHIQSVLAKKSSDLSVCNFSFSTRPIVGLFLQPFSSLCDGTFYYTTSDAMRKRLNVYKQLRSKSEKRKEDSFSGQTNNNSNKCASSEKSNEPKSTVDVNPTAISGLFDKAPTNEKNEVKLFKIDHSENFFDEHGYLYSRNNTKQVKNSYFRCKNSVRYGCGARVKADGNDLEKCILTQKHNHRPRCGKVDKEKFDKQLKKECEENPFLYPREIYTKTRKLMKNKINPINIPLKGRYDTLIHSRKRKYIPKLPKTVDEFESLIQNYKEQYFYDERNLPFYREVWKTKAGEKNVVFVSESVLKKLKEMKVNIHMLMDGTFKVLPKHIKFRQLYIISIIFEDRCYPLAYILMEKKTYYSYNLIFSKLKLLFPSCEISNFMTDYEAATRKALKRQLPNARISGCYFHYVKAINKAARRFGLSKDSKFETAIQKVSTLALLPNEFVRKGFEIIDEENRDLKYSLRWSRFKKYWKRQWRKANISVFGLRHRTNNFAESMNKSLNVLIKIKVPNIWILIENLKTLEMDKTDELEQHDLGIMFETVKKEKSNGKDKMNRLNKKIEEATKIFRKTRDVARFLRNVTAGDKLEDFFKDRIYLEGIDDYDYYEDSGFDEDDEEDFIPNDLDPNCNFFQEQSFAVKRKRDVEGYPKESKKRRA